jgi:hypothetical protein
MERSELQSPDRPGSAAVPAATGGRHAGIQTGMPPLRYRPIWNVQQKAIAMSACEPAGDMGGQTASGEVQCALLRHMLLNIGASTSRDGVPTICLPARHAVLSGTATRAAFVEICDGIAPERHATLLWEIAETPEDVGERTLFSMVATLKPFGRAVFLRSRLTEGEFDIPAAVGVHSIGIDLAETMAPESEIVLLLEKFADRAHRSGLRCHAHGLATSSLSLAAMSCGFDYLSGDAIAEAAPAPAPVRPFDAESLFLRTSVPRG